jgi:serine O-acetyltransferase
MAQPQRITPIESVDPIWARIRSEAEAVVRQEPQLASFIYASLLEHDTLTGAVVHRISDRLDHPVMSGATILQAFLDALADSPEIVDAFRADIVATYDRDPATTRFIEPACFFGFHAIQTHRLPTGCGKKTADLRLCKVVPRRCSRPISTRRQKSVAASLSTMPPASWSVRPR